MSHAPERKERNCLNCGTILHGRFCHICGQENIEPKESFWELVAHFFNDITHFDGKFFTTLKDLLFKPGFLPKEYITGRRASYLNPVRMYVFTSAIFFLIFFAFFQRKEAMISTTTVNNKTIEQIDAMDSASFAEFTAHINKENDKPAQPMTRAEFKKYMDSALVTGIHFTGRRYKSRAEYDSLLAAGVKKHNWLQRQLIYKEIDVNEKYHNNTRQILTAIRQLLLHSLPQMLFVSLPLLALILKLLYVRRKQFYYVSHLIFSIHLYIFLFIAILLLFSLSKLNDNLHWGVLNFIFTLLVISTYVYQYLAIKNFYRQGWIKSFFKFLLLSISFFLMVGVLFVVFIAFSFFNI